MNRDLIYEIPESLYGHKISELLHQKGFSNQNLTALKKMDHSVMINGRWEYLNYRLRPGDLLEIHIQEEEVSEVRWMDFSECIEAVRTNSIPHCIYMEELEILNENIS